MVKCEECGYVGEWHEFVGWCGKRVCKRCKEILKDVWIIEHETKH